MNKTKEFLRIFKKAEKKYAKSKYRLAGDKSAWGEDWKVLIATILSAQSRDETTIPIAENLFKKYDSLEKLSKAKYSGVFEILKSMNYNKTKSKHVIACAKALVSDFGGKIPGEIDELVKLPGVGRKTAALVMGECFGKDAICVDTHVHRISNVFEIVDTKTPNDTEKELMKVAPKRYWSKINRIFVLWGKNVAGNDKDKLESVLDR
jgi:endonuclease-3